MHNSLQINKTLFQTAEDGLESKYKRVRRMVENYNLIRS